MIQSRGRRGARHTHTGRSAGGPGLTKGSLPPVPGPPLTDSLTRGHCRLFYSLETTHHKTPQKPSWQVWTADPGPAVPTCRCRLYDAPPTSQSRRIRATGLALKGINSRQRQLCMWTGSLQGCTASGFRVTVRHGYRSPFTVVWASCCCMQSYTVFVQVTHLTNLFLKNRIAIWGTTAWSRVCDKGRGTRAALTPRNGFTVPPQGS